MENVSSAKLTMKRREAMWRTPAISVLSAKATLQYRGYAIAVPVDKSMCLASTDSPRFHPVYKIPPTTILLSAVSYLAFSRGDALICNSASRPNSQPPTSILDSYMPPSPSRTKLLHIHFKPRIAYSTSLLLQEQLLNLHWQHRAALKSPTPATPRAIPPPPCLLTFSTHPTYTVGRRHLLANPLSPDQIAYLTSTSTSSVQSHPVATAAATFYPTSRGGLLTYHGPGQLTGYPILDLRRFGLSARCYVRLLENAVSRTCNEILSAEHGGTGKNRAGRSVNDPGVWMLEDGQSQQQQQQNNSSRSDSVEEANACPSDNEAPVAPASDRKICALGVQVTRGVTAHGVGLNVLDEPFESSAQTERFSFDDDTFHRCEATDPAAFGQGRQTELSKDNNPGPERGYLSWGFSRIVACGLEGKSTTWLTREGARLDLQVDTVASHLARNIVRGIDEMGNGKDDFDEAPVQTVWIEDPDVVTALSEEKVQLKELLPAVD